jgi:hypothetical protein
MASLSLIRAGWRLRPFLAKLDVFSPYEIDALAS